MRPFHSTKNNGSDGTVVNGHGNHGNGVAPVAEAGGLTGKMNFPWESRYVLRKGVYLQSYSGDGIWTINPTLGRGVDSQGVKPPPVFLMFNWDQCTRSFVEILNDKPVRKPCWIYFVGKFPGHKMFKSLPGFLLHSIKLMEEIMHPQPSGVNMISKSSMVLLMEEILHQLRLVVYPFIPLFTRFYTFQVGVAGFIPSTVSPGFAMNRWINECRACLPEIHIHLWSPSWIPCFCTSEFAQKKDWLDKWAMKKGPLVV